MMPECRVCGQVASDLPAFPLTVSSGTPDNFLVSFILRIRERVHAGSTCAGWQS